MDMDGFVSAMDMVSGSLQAILNVLIFIAKFLFLSPWGWILIFIAFVSILIVKVKNKNDRVTFYSFVGGFTETMFSFYSNISIILIGVFLIFTISVLFKSFDDFSSSLRLFKETKILEATLKNLEANRKVMEVSAVPVKADGTTRMNVSIKYFAYSPVKDASIQTGEKVYTIDGNKLYVDFGVINFKYSLIEKGETVNLAFPNKIYSESVSYKNGKSILAVEQSVPLSFKLNDEDIFTISEDDYTSQLAKIFVSVTNKHIANKLGIRTSYGQSISLTPKSGKTYRIYTTGVGGVIVK